MWKCPVCGEHNLNNSICTGCGYDKSTDYFKYKTLAKIPDSIRKNYGQKHGNGQKIPESGKSVMVQSETMPEKKQSRKIVSIAIGMALVAILSIGIVIGNTKKESPGNSNESSTNGDNNTAIQDQSAEQEQRKNLLMSDEIEWDSEWDNETVFGSQYLRKDIEKIIFQNTLKDVSQDSWDVSADKSGSVRAWVQNGILYIAADGNIEATSCKALFAFYRNLEYIIFNNCFKTSNVEDMSYMFYLCESLISADVSGFDTSQVTDMMYMFSECENLTSIDVSGFDTSQVTNMGGMFDWCTSLISVDVSGFNTGKVNYMGEMFAGCYDLSEVDVSGFDTSKVIDMGGMFGWCTSLTSVDVSGFDTSQVTYMGSMFESCESLTSVDVSGFDTSQVTYMGSMFESCESLTSIDVSGFNTSQVTDMNEMFYGCKALTSVDVSGFDITNVTNMEDMFTDSSITPIVGNSGIKP